MRFGRYIVGLPTAPEKRPSPEPRIADLMRHRWMDDWGSLSSKALTDDPKLGDSARDAVAEERR